MPERLEIYIVYKRRYINTLPFLLCRQPNKKWLLEKVLLTPTYSRFALAKLLVSKLCSSLQRVLHVSSAIAELLVINNNGRLHPF